MEELDGKQGVMKVSLKDENGMVLTQEYGFTIEQENGEILSFDLHDHPDFGLALLFGNQVFFLKYWDDDQLEKGLKMIQDSFARELNRRKENE